MKSLINSIFLSYLLFLYCYPTYQSYGTMSASTNELYRSYLRANSYNGQLPDKTYHVAFIAPKTKQIFDNVLYNITIIKTKPDERKYMDQIRPLKEMIRNIKNNRYDSIDLAYLLQLSKTTNPMYTELLADVYKDNEALEISQVDVFKLYMDAYSLGSKTAYNKAIDLLDDMTPKEKAQVAYY